jgi:RecB family exonuclease
MPARLYPCTPTRLATWLDCPRRYRFTYLDRPPPPKGPPWAHNSVGAAVHSALADWWGLPFAARVPQAGERAVRARWLTDGFRDAEQSAAARERAVRWVSEYLSRVDAGDEPVGVERTVSTPTARLVLSGRVDRIDVRPGPGGESELVIVDYKTGRHVPGGDEARSSLALATYAMAAARTLRRPCRRVELHHLPSGSRAVAVHTTESLARKVAEAESIAMDAASADMAFARGDRGTAPGTVFAPRPSGQCSWCDFRRHCPPGQEAAPEVEPWAGLGILGVSPGGP